MIYLTRKDVALRLQISLSTVNRYIKQGKLKAIKIGGKLVRITEDSFQELIKAGKGGKC